MSRTKHLDAAGKVRIQTLLAVKSVSEVAKELRVSRNTVYRWKTRHSISRKSRRPKTNTACLLPVQRDVICELIRLSRWPKCELLPLVIRLFPVFKHVGEGGQRRLWKEVVGTGKLPSMKLNSAEPFYRSSFRVGAIFVAQEGMTSPVCVLAAWETISGALVHRVVQGSPHDATDFLLDLCHEWPFQISEITLVSTENADFPGLPGVHTRNVPKVQVAAMGEEFQRLWTRLPPVSASTSPRAGPQITPPTLSFEVSPNRAQIIELPRRFGTFNLDGVKKVVRSRTTKHNTRLRGEGSSWAILSRQVMTPEEYLIRAWELARMNGAVKDEPPAETRANLRQLLTHPLAKYSENKRARSEAIRGSTSC